MYKADGSLDWRAVSAFVALLVGLFAVTGYLTDDKIDSKVQQHEIITETKHSIETMELKREIAVIGTRQESLIGAISDLKEQNKQIIKKLDER